MNAALSQWMTPAWAARELWEAHFHDVGFADLVVEPTCGDGRMLQAVPSWVPAKAWEIDPERAAEARARCPHREIVTGDFLSAEIPRETTLIFGNPPFKAAFLDAMLEHVHEFVADGCRSGTILPAYFMQSPSRVLRWNRAWTICCELLPRTLFSRSQLPIIFAIFTKDPVPKLSGMRLYYEADAVSEMKPAYREEMVSGSGQWKTVVRLALRELGGKAKLKDIYEQVSPKRPTPNEWWREKVRQTLQRGSFISHGGGVWELDQSAA